MKARRMLLMVLIAAAMVFTAMLNVAYADEDDWQDVPENTEEIDEIETDKTKDVDISSEGETVTFKFTPEEDGVYEFRSFQDGPYDDYDSLDTVGRVLIWNGNEYEEIMENDDNDENYHFCMKFKAEKEKTYYLQARMLSKPSEAVSFHVKLIDTGILEIEYKQKNQLELQYLVDGYYRNRYDDDDNFLGSFFRYYIGRKLPMDQDQFTIKKKNGDDITYVYNAENRQFECDGSDPIRYYDFDFDCVDSYNWDLGEHQAEVYYDGFTTETTVKVVENDIKAVSFQKKEPVTYYENDIDSGEWQGEGEDKYYCYYKPWLITGDKLTVTYTDDSSREFTLKYEDEEEEPVFMSEDGTVIDKGAVLISDEQETRHWGIGENLDEKPDGNNFYTVSYGGKKSYNPVNIIASPVEQISFTPATEYKLIENNEAYGELDVYWDDNDERHDFFYYFIPSREKDDELTVKFKDGDTKVYKFNNSTDQFVNEEDPEDTIDENEISTYSNQGWIESINDSNIWTLGSENYFIMSYKAVTCQVPVAIIENPIKDIRFEPDKPYELREIDDGSFMDYGDDEHNYWYYSIDYSEGDKLILETKTEGDKVYTYQPDEEGEEGYFVNGSERISQYDISKLHDQYNDHWLPDKENYFTISYLGFETKVPVTIIKDPVVSITYKPVNDYEFMENDTSAGQYYNKGTSNEWFHYDVNFKEGDKLTVTKDDGSIEVYTAEWSDYGWHFTNGTDTIEAVYNWYEPGNVCLIDNQHKNHWTAGENNSFTIKYRACTYQVPVTIVENPVKSISFTPADDFAFIKNDTSRGRYENKDTADEWFYYHIEYCEFFEGNKLTIEMTDDTVKEYTSQYIEGDGWYYVSDNDETDTISFSEVLFNEYQYRDHWDIGADNFFYVQYMGRECSASATIIENPIKSMSFTPASDIEFIQNDTGKGSYQDKGTEYEWFWYNLYYFWYKDGNKLTLKMIDDSIKTYTSRFDEAEGWVFVSDSDESERISFDYVQYNEDQYLNHWELGNNSFTVEYLGRQDEVTVTIVENPIDRIEYTPYGGFSYIEEDVDRGFYEGKDTDEPWFYYYNPGKNEDDVLTVYYNDDTSKTYKCRFIEEESDLYFVEEGGEDRFIQHDVIFNDNQYDKHWEKGTNNYITVTYMGRSVEVPVTITENPIKSISFTPKDAYEFMEYDEKYGCYYDEGTEYEFFHYYIPAFAEGDELTVNDKVYVYQVAEEGENYFISEDDEKIYQSELTYDYHQYSNQPWVPDGNNYYIIHYGHRSCNVPVTILKSEATLRREAVEVANTLLAQIEGINEAEYTEDTYSVFAAAKEALIEVINDDSSESGDIKEKIGDLNSAVGGLKTKEQEAAEIEAAAKETAKQAADTAIKNAAALVESDYTEDTYKAVKEAKAALEAVLNDDNSTSTDINNATKTLNDAIAGLKTKEQEAAEKEAAAKEIAKQDADTAIKSAANLKADDYTEDTYKSVADAKAALETVLKNDKATSTDINNATKALNDAIAGLKTKEQDATEKEAAAKETAKQDADKALKGAADLKADDYTEDSYKAVTDAKAALETVLKNDKATSTDINNAVKALNDAVAGLKTKEQDAAEKEAAAKEAAKQDADKALKGAADLKTEDYTEDSYKAVADAKAALETVLKNDKATSADINNAVKALSDAMAGLKTKAEDAAEKEAAAKETAKQDADKAIKSADAVKADDYTDDTYKAVADAKAALEAVLKDEKATSADINNAVKALSDAMAGLKTKAEAEKEEAEKQEAAAKAQAMADADAAIAEINAIDPAGFTEESYSAVLDAMAALEAVLKDENATSVQINDAIKALRAAKEALKAKEEPAVEKLDNTMKVTAKKVTVKFKSLRKKNQTVKKKNAFTVKKPAGKVTFKLYKKDKKAKNKITINKKGNITVKKGLKKGKYTIRVKVTAAGNATYKKLTKQVKVKITVK